MLVQASKYQVKTRHQHCSCNRRAARKGKALLEVRSQHNERRHARQPGINEDPRPTRHSHDFQAHLLKRLVLLGRDPRLPARHDLSQVTHAALLYPLLESQWSVPEGHLFNLRLSGSAARQAGHGKRAASRLQLRTLSINTQGERSIVLGARSLSAFLECLY